MLGDRDKYEFMAPVGSFPPNPFGLYDMYGNAAEMCRDAGTPNYAGHTADGDPPSFADPSTGVTRGGGADCPAWYCRSGWREIDLRGSRGNNRGFRIALSIGGPDEEGEHAEKRPPDERVTSATAATQSKPASAAAVPKISRPPFLVRGEWRIENDELVQPTLAADVSWWEERVSPLLAFGDETLSNYDLTLEMKKTGGSGAVGVQFHWLGPGHYRRFDLAENRMMNSYCFDNGQPDWKDSGRKGLIFASDRWYSLKVEVRGESYRTYLDDELQFIKQTDARFTHGRLCLFTDAATARFRRIRLSDPQGNVLFQGLPELPPPANSANSSPSLAGSPRVLTEGETAAKNSQKEYAQRAKLAVISTNSLGMKLALIPPGTYQMGSAESERWRGGNEQQHEVRITKAFYLGIDEVTQSEFERVMGRNLSRFRNSGGPAEAATGPDTSRFPVEGLSWYDAVEFCNKLSDQEKLRPCYRFTEIEREANGQIVGAKVTIENVNGYRLPTEAQWEYACRAGTTTRFNFGTANNGTECNCGGQEPLGTDVKGPTLGRPVPVGSYRPNAFGLYDMHGNVWEWCWDVFDDAYYKRSPSSDPTGPAEGASRAERVQRGGCWNYMSASCRTAGRGHLPADYRWDGTGFRIARDATGKAQ